VETNVQLPEVLIFNVPDAGVGQFWLHIFFEDKMQIIIAINNCIFFIVQYFLICAYSTRFSASPFNSLHLVSDFLFCVEFNQKALDKNEEWKTPGQCAKHHIRAIISEKEFR
jgi:hypothetical protein